MTREEHFIRYLQKKQNIQGFPIGKISLLKRTLKIRLNVKEHPRSYNSWIRWTDWGLNDEENERLLKAHTELRDWNSKYFHLNKYLKILPEPKFSDNCPF